MVIYSQRKGEIEKRTPSWIYLDWGRKPQCKLLNAEGRVSPMEEKPNQQREAGGLAEWEDHIKGNKGYRACSVDWKFKNA